MSKVKFTKPSFSKSWTKKIKPEIRALFMSGYPADIIHKHEIVEKGFAYIEKPASPTKLLRKIREVLGQ